MSDTSTGDPGKSMEQPSEDLSEVMRQLSMTTDVSDKTSPSLSGMPIDIVTLITEKLDYKEKLKLRKVSKSLRTFVDKQKPACTSIQVECRMENVNLIFDDQHVMYTKQLYDYEDEDDDGIIVLRDDFKKAAFDDLASTLKNPKLQLEKFSISRHFFEKKDPEEYYSEIQRVVESLNHQVSVKKVDLDICVPSNLLSILPFLKPGVLGNIWLDVLGDEVDWSIDSNGMDQVARLKQWKQAEVLELYDCFDLFPMEYATHFKRFHIGELHVDKDKFIRIIDYLSKLQNFEQCTLACIYFQSRLDILFQVLGAPVSSSATEEVFHYSIPDSDYYLEFKKGTGSIVLEITKKKRETH